MLITLENNRAVLQVKHRVTIWPSNSTLRYLPNRMKTYVNTKTCTQMFLAAFFYNKKSKTNRVFQMVKDRCIISIQWNIIGNKISTDAYYCRWIFKKLCWVKEARPKRPQNLWLHLSEKLRLDKYVETESRIVVG